VDDSAWADDAAVGEDVDGGHVEKAVPPKIPDAPKGLVAGAGAMLKSASPVLGAVAAIPKVVTLIQMLAGQDAGLSDRAIEQIAELLDQNRLVDANWRIESKGGELYDAEAVYLRYQCVTNKTTPCNSANAMFTNALSLHGKASTAFRDIYTGTKPLGFAKLQLVPLLIHAGTTMVFAHHEIGLAERALNASATDLANRQTKMAEAATTVLMALDEAEDLYDEFVRSKFGDVSVSKVRAGCLRPGPRGCGSYRYNYVASVRGPDGTVHKSSTLASETSARNNMDLRLAALKNDYTLANSAKVFTSEYASVRQELRRFAGNKYKGIFRWSPAGPIAGMHCTKITESAEPAAHTWNDNYFCSSRYLAMRWSEKNAINGLRCTKITESADPHGWSDNYLCLPSNSPWTFSWSGAGTITGKICTWWVEGRDPHTWNDNFLCVNPR
jgi:hypothetical protein